jgi:AmmeMemoRadiSam system protein A
MLSPSEDESRALLRLARQTVIDAVTSGRLPEEIPQQGFFAQRCGVFVTLHVGRRLRGCIGVIDADKPLGENIVRCAVSAALQDPRFPAMRPEELPELAIEISVLSAPAPIRPEEIQIGLHGLLISRGRQRGVLLPQVATEHQLTPQQFLAETCRKAQLAPDAWRGPGVELLGFTCEVFSEEAGPAEK